ncbi:NADH dehydrogenase [ubiquinone] 1 beta subcomplex subunit 10 [Thrips palmi]|uniref:NADH dehydrogenase [ubiquinone] 1 beta subcomplex subunit 10 n=1 Tax=Thrips palmi TaxID=161013 RepID=A0A6P8ZTS5_THRPL|nr:NADH dehydrogenase [ubiquinone] 1 beta subcomplex subunit 10 [Thrips palmi]
MADTTFLKFINAFGRAVDGPVTWWRETIVTPNQQKHYWYHRKYPRVPTVDQCYTDDPVCIFEADQQLERDMAVDGQIVSILRQRSEFCVRYHGGQDENAVRECKPLWDMYQEAAGNYFCKYGDMGFKPSSKEVYMKEKHRLIWERRYGKVGSGMGPKEE